MYKIVSVSMWGRQTVLISVAQSQLHQPRAAKELMSLLLIPKVT